MARLSAELNRYFFVEDCPDPVTLAKILEFSGERAFGVLFLLLAFPSALPLPAPGYSAPFGVVLFWFATQLMRGYPAPHLPTWLEKRTVALSQVQDVLNVGLPWLKRAEILTRPRLTPICISRVGRLILGIAIALMGLCMMIPIPGTNTLPAIGAFVTGLGLIEDDGAISLAGLTICVLGLCLSISILVFLVIVGGSFTDWLKSWLETQF
ncbi:MAG: exopolysaccharide biosynthesis protein [Cyanobacteria bacterium P01_H01_bin.121]